MSSSLLLQQCLACLFRLTLIEFVMGGRWPYSCIFVGSWFHYIYIYIYIYMIKLDEPGTQDTSGGAGTAHK